MPVWQPVTTATCRMTTSLHKFAFKAQDGSWHSTVFTLRWEPQVIRLSERAKPVVRGELPAAATAMWSKRWRLPPTAPIPIAAVGTAIARRRTARFAAFRQHRRYSSRDCRTFPNSTKSPPLAADRHGLRKGPIRADNFEEPHHDDVPSILTGQFAILRATAGNDKGLARLAAPGSCRRGDIRFGNPGLVDLASPRGSGAKDSLAAYRRDGDGCGPLG